MTEETVSALPDGDEAATSAPSLLAFPDWLEQNQATIKEPLAKYRGYSDYVKQETLAQGKYSDTLVQKLDAKLAGLAVEAGDYVSPSPDAEPLVSDVLARPKSEELPIQSLFNTAYSAETPEDDPLRGAVSKYEAIRRLQDEGRSTPEELAAAEAEVRQLATPEVMSRAVRKDVKEGRSLAAIVPPEDPEGRPTLEINDSLLELRDENGNIDMPALGKTLKMHGIDASLIPSILDRLTRPEGYAKTKVEIERHGEAMSQFGTLVMTPDANGNWPMQKEIARIAERVESGQDVDKYIDAQIEQGTLMIRARQFVEGTPLAEKSDAELRDMLKDAALMQAAPELDMEDPGKHVRATSTGRVVVPLSVMLNDEAYEKVRNDRSRVPLAQVSALDANRDSALEVSAVDIIRTISDSPQGGAEFVNYMDSQRAAGKKDSEIVKGWISQGNFSATQTHIKNAAFALLDSVAPLAFVATGADPDGFAMSMMKWSQKEDANRRAYAELFGYKPGIGYDLTKQLAPMAVDMGVGLLTGGTAAVATTAVRGSARTAVKSLLRSALTPTSKAGFAAWTKAAPRAVATGLAESGIAKAGLQVTGRETVEELVTMAGRDITSKIVTGASKSAFYASAFNRSAMSTYASLSTTLAGQTNPDGSAKYSPEEVKEISMTHALASGSITVGAMGVMAGIGIPGIEKVFGTSLSRGQLNKVWERLRKDVSKLPPGTDMSSAQAMVSSMVKEGVRPIFSTKTLAGRAGNALVAMPEPVKAALSEAPEEALDEFMQSFNEAIATGDKIDIRKAANAALYAGMLGGLVGGTVTGVTSTVQNRKAPPARVEADIRRERLLEMAAKLESTAPQTAQVFRNYAFQQRALIPQRQQLEGDLKAAKTPEAKAEIKAKIDTLNDNATRSRTEELAPPVTTEEGIPEADVAEGAVPPPSDAGMDREGEGVAAGTPEGSAAGGTGTVEPATRETVETEFSQIVEESQPSPEQPGLGAGAATTGEPAIESPTAPTADQSPSPTDSLPEGQVAPVADTGAASLTRETLTPDQVEEVRLLEDLKTRRGQKENGVKGVKFTKTDQTKFEILGKKYRSLFVESTDPQNDPVVGVDINGTNIQRSSQGTLYTFENGRVRTGPAFEAEGFGALATTLATPLSAKTPAKGDGILPGLTMPPRKRSLSSMRDATVDKLSAVETRIARESDEDVLDILNRGRNGLIKLLGNIEQVMLAEANAARIRSIRFTDGKPEVRPSADPEDIVTIAETQDVPVVEVVKGRMPNAAPPTAAEVAKMDYSELGKAIENLDDDARVAFVQSEVARRSASDPNVGLEWDSPYGRQRIIGWTNSGGTLTLTDPRYEVATVGSGEIRTYTASKIQETIDGDTYKLSPEYAEAQTQMAQRQVEAKRREEDAAAQKAAAEQRMEPYLDSATTTSLQKGKLKSTLSETERRNVSSTGKKYSGTRFEVAAQMVADGYTATVVQVPGIKDVSRAQFNRMDNREQQAFARRKAAAGTKPEYRLAAEDGTYFKVTKVEHDLAIWLKNNPTQNDTRGNTQGDSTLGETAQSGGEVQVAGATPSPAGDRQPIPGSGRPAPASSPLPATEGRGNAGQLTPGTPITFTATTPPGYTQPTQGTVDRVENGRVFARVGRTVIPGVTVIESAPPTISDILADVPEGYPLDRDTAKLVSAAVVMPGGLVSALNSNKYVVQAVRKYAAWKGIAIEGMNATDLAIVVGGELEADSVLAALRGESVVEVPVAKPAKKKAKKAVGILGEKIIRKDWTELTEEEGPPPLSRDLIGYNAWRREVAAMVLPEGTDIQREALVRELAEAITTENYKPGIESWQHHIIAGNVAAQLMTGKRKDILEKTKVKALGDEYSQWFMGGVFEEQPISVEAFDTHSKNPKLPEGYVKQGDLYVYQPDTPRNLPSSTPSSAVTAELNKFGFSEGLTAFLTNVSKKGGKQYAPLAKLLLDAGAANVDTRLVNLPNTEAAGFYVGANGVVHINTAKNGPRGAVDTVLHELVHAVTEGSLRNPTPAQAKVIARIERVRATVTKRAKANGTYDNDLQYALGDNAEFLTHFFTSQRFRDQVSAMTPKSEKNWLQVIADLIADLFTGRTKAQKMEADLRKELTTLITAPRTGLAPSDVVMRLPAENAEPDFAAAEQKFNNQVNEYVTGNWPSDTEGRYAELMSFAGQWAATYTGVPVTVIPDTETTSRLRISDTDITRVELRGGNAFQTSQVEGITEAEAKRLIANEVNEEVIHYLHFEAVRKRIGASASDSEVATEIRSTYLEMFNHPDAAVRKEFVRYAYESYLAYTKQEPDAETAKNPEPLMRYMMLGNPEYPYVAYLAAYEAVRQIVQARSFGITTEARFVAFGERTIQWFKDRLAAIRSYASRTKVLSNRMERDIIETERALNTLRGDIRFQPTSDARNVARFHQLTESLKGASSRSEVRTWAVSHRSAYVELLGMLEGLLTGTKIPDNFRGREGATMDSSVFGGADNLQVLNTVIQAIPVDMVDVFGSKQRATYMLFHQPAVFGDILTIYGDVFRPDALASVNEVVAGEAARIRTKLGVSSGAALTNTEVLSALQTFQNSLVSVGGDTSFDATRDSRGKIADRLHVKNLRLARGSETLPSAESPSVVLELTRDDEKFGRADFASSFNRHGLDSLWFFKDGQGLITPDRWADAASPDIRFQPAAKPALLPTEQQFNETISQYVTGEWNPGQREARTDQFVREYAQRFAPTADRLGWIFEFTESDDVVANLSERGKPQIEFGMARMRGQVSGSEVNTFRAVAKMVEEEFIHAAHLHYLTSEVADESQRSAEVFRNSAKVFSQIIDSIRNGGGDAVTEAALASLQTYTPTMTLADLVKMANTNDYVAQDNFVNEFVRQMVQMQNGRPTEEYLAGNKNFLATFMDWLKEKLASLRWAAQNLNLVSPALKENVEGVQAILGDAASPDIRFQPAARNKDAEYLAAVQAGDMETAQRMVDSGEVKMTRGIFDELNVRPELTQRATTIHKRLAEQGVIQPEDFENGKGLVYGDGKGVASGFLGAESYEPFPPAGFQPDYSGDRSAGVGSPIGKKYATILNTFVLNVVDPQTRGFIVRDIANLLEKSGRAVIVTRGTDVLNSTPLQDFGGMSRLQKSGSGITYQKGFTQPELVAYLQDTLGEGFTVQPLKGGSSGDVRAQFVKNTDRSLSNPLAVDSSVRFQPSNKRDAEYLTAVEAGDMDTAQRMVDEAAQAAGYDTNQGKAWWHGSKIKNLTTFDLTTRGSASDFGALGSGFYFSPTKGVAEAYVGKTRSAYPTVSGSLIKAYLKMAKSATATQAQVVMSRLKGEGDFTQETSDKTREYLTSKGYDSVIGDEFFEEVLVFNPEQIKSADPVTYYPKGHPKEGKPIPLSERFQSTSPDIRFQGLTEQDFTPASLRDTATGFLPDDVTLNDLTIDFADLADITEGLDPVNAENAVHAAVNHALARRAGEAAIPAPVRSEFDSDEAFDAATAEHAAEVARLTDTYELITRGRLNSEAMFRYRTNPGALQRLVDYLTAAIKAAYNRFTARYDVGTAVALNRMSRDLARARGGFNHDIEPMAAYDPDAAEVRFQFAGESANTPQFMRDSLDTAKAMAAAGKPSEKIRAVTGWFPGKYDGKMRWEIPDAGAKLKIGEVKKGHTAKLPEVLDHPALFAAYPELVNVDVVFGNYPQDTSGGGYLAKTNTREVPEISLTSRNPGSKALSSLLHEIQHIIQDAEVFARGGNVFSIDKAPAPQQRAIRKLFAEVELDRARDLDFKYRDSHNAVLDFASKVSAADLVYLNAQAADQTDKTSIILERVGYDIWSDIEDAGSVEAAVKEAKDSLSWVDQLTKLATNTSVDPSKENAALLDAHLRTRGFTTTYLRAYRQVAGEIEARDIEARANLTPEQLAATAPYSSENIAPEDAIVLMDSSGVSQSVRFQPAARPASPARQEQQLLEAEAPMQRIETLFKRDPGVKAGADITPSENKVIRRLAEFFINPFGALSRSNTKSKQNRDAMMETVEYTVSTLSKRLDAARRKEDADQTLVQLAVGNIDPLLTPAMQEKIADDFVNEVSDAEQEIEASYEQEAATNPVLAAENRAVALAEAHSEAERNRQKAIWSARSAEADSRRAQQLQALAQLERTAPDTYEAIIDLRGTVNQLQRLVKEANPDSPEIHAIVDQSFGVYLVRSYGIHQDPKQIDLMMNSQEPLYVERREALTAFFKEKAFEQIMSELDKDPQFFKQYGQSFDYDKALADMREIAEAESGDRAKLMFEDYMLSRQSARGTFGEGSTVTNEIQRYMAKANMPQEFLDALMVNEDPVFNIANTAMSLSRLVFNSRMLNEIYDSGIESGRLITEAEFKTGITYADGKEEMRRVFGTEGNDEVKIEVLEEIVNHLEQKAKEAYDNGRSDTPPDRDALYVQAAAAMQDFASTPNAQLSDILPQLGRRADRTATDTFISSKNLSRESKAKLQARPGRFAGWLPLVTTNVGNSAFKPLGGMYAEPEQVKAFNATFRINSNGIGHFADDFVNKAHRSVIAAAGASLLVATQGSPSYYVRNVVGNTFVGLMSGVTPFNPKNIALAGRTFRSLINERGEPTAEMQELIAGRIVMDAAQIGYIKQLIEDYTGNPDATVEELVGESARADIKAGKLAKGSKKAAKAFMGKLAKLSEATEVLATVMIYADFKRILEEANFGSEIEIIQEASRLTKRVTPGRSETASGVTALTRSGFGALFAPFLRFKVDTVRIMVNSLKLAHEMSNSDNPVLKKHGRIKMASWYSTVGLLSIAMPLIFQRAFGGFGEDEDEAIRASLPDYYRNASLFYFRNKANDGLTIINTTFTNPLSFVGDPISRITNAALFGDASDIPGILGRFVTEDFIGENIVASNVMDVMRNKDSNTDYPIYFEADSDTDKVMKSAIHLGKAYTPRIFIQGDRFVDSLRREGDQEFWYSPLGVALATVAPFRPMSKTFDDMERAAFNNIRKENSELWRVTSPIFSPAPLAAGEATERYAERVAIMEKQARKALELYDGFTKIRGGDEASVKRSAVGAGMSKRRATLLFNRGLVERLVFPEDDLRRVREIDPARYDEIKAAMRARPSLSPVER